MREKDEILRSIGTVRQAVVILLLLIGLGACGGSSTTQTGTVDTATNEPDRLADFTVYAAGRHAFRYNVHDRHNIYDQSTHAYVDSYVHPTKWSILLDSCSQWIEIQESHITPQEAQEAEIPWPGNEIKVLKVPQNVESYTWKLEQIDGANNYVIEQSRDVQEFCRAEVEVSSVGHYSISMTVNLNDGQTAQSVQDFQLKDLLIVSLGDSYASGEGMPDVAGINIEGEDEAQCELTTLALKFDWSADFGTDPMWLEPKAHRSLESGPSRGVLLFESPSEGRLTTFLSFATSGATVLKGLLSPQHGWQDVGQVQEAKRTVGDRPIHAVIVSVGGNDIGFEGTIESLVADDFGPWRESDLNAARTVFQDRLEALKGNLSTLAKEIQTQLSPDKVLITEYPAGLFDKSVAADGRAITRQGCGVFSGPDLDIDVEDAEFIRWAGEHLNGVLRDFAEEHDGWIYVGGIESGFRGHGYCSNVGRFFVTAEHSCRTQGDFDGTLHPNAEGAQVYAEQIAKALRDEQTIAPPTPTPIPTLRQCGAGQVCCESDGEGNCLLCIPAGASCP